MLQSRVIDLSRDFIERGMTVLVETNGTQNIDQLPNLAIKIMDIKCPGSGESGKMDWKNVDRLSARDNIKFVISDRADFDWAVDVVMKYHLQDRTAVLFSPAFRLLKADLLASWLLDLSLPIRLNLQLHKYIWNPDWRGV